MYEVVGNAKGMIRDYYNSDVLLGELAKNTKEEQYWTSRKEERFGRYFNTNRATFLNGFSSSFAPESRQFPVLPSLAPN